MALRRKRLAAWAVSGKEISEAFVDVSTGAEIMNRDAGFLFVDAVDDAIPDDSKGPKFAQLKLQFPACQRICGNVPDPGSDGGFNRRVEPLDDA
jgi:hypothetical protein